MHPQRGFFELLITFRPPCRECDLFSWLRRHHWAKGYSFHMKYFAGVHSFIHHDLAAYSAHQHLPEEVK